MKNECPACGAVYSVTPQHVGRRIACKKCSAALVVEADGIQLVGGGPREPDPPRTVAEGLPAQPFPVSKSELPPLPAEAIEAEALPRRAPAAGNAFVDFLLFRRMLTPILIHIVFWVSVVCCLLSGAATLLSALLVRGNDIWTILLAVVFALAQIVLGPILMRVLCEAILVVFRIHETLREIRDKE